MSRFVPLVCAFCLSLTGLASAQSLGTFRWQLQPYCNVLTLAVTQVGAQYRFEGFDDQCGAATRAAVTGLGVANADGTIEFGLTIVGANGPQHVDVTFSIGPLGGPWRDGSGVTGTLVFLPSGAGSGAPRPAPALPDGSVTGPKLAAGAVDGTKIVDGAVAGADVNAAEVQRRVTGTCGTGLYVQSVAADGTVSCGTDSGGVGTITGVTAGAGLSGGGPSGAVSLSVNFLGSGAAATVARSDHFHGRGASGERNTAVGESALAAVTSGGLSNTAVGQEALNKLTSGDFNVAVGQGSLGLATTASQNTAVGAGALGGTTSGVGNTAIGIGALGEATTGAENIAVGGFALASNTGSRNTVLGFGALGTFGNATENVAVGHSALASATTGGTNVAVGFQAMMVNTTGAQNVALGTQALFSSVNGAANVAIGTGALGAATGSFNVGLGRQAASSLAAGNNNIIIGDGAGANLGTGVVPNNSNILIANPGANDDVGQIRIGTNGTHTGVHVAGVYGTPMALGLAVAVDANGKLGAPSPSSRRFKEQIEPLDDVRAVVQALQPVTFYYKPEFAPGRARQYGLIAEQVAEVMPDMVILNAAGEIQSVHYQMLAPLLLAEVQRLERDRAAQQAAIEALQRELAALRARFGTR